MKVKDSIEIKKEERIKWPKVAIIILNWNGWKDTIECLESVYRNTYPNYQVVVIDNGSTDGSMERIKAWADGKQEVLTPEPSHPLYNLSHPNVKKPIPYIQYTREEAEKGGDFERENEIIFNWMNENNELFIQYPLILIQIGDNLGFAGGNNVGIRYVLYNNNINHFLLLNNDIVVDKNFLEPLMQIIERNKTVGVVGPKVYSYEKYPEIYCAGCNMKIHPLKGLVISERGKGEIDCGQYDRIENVGNITGCCLGIRREAIKAAGLMDERFFLYFEETDWIFRIKRVGLGAVYVPNSIVWHKGSNTVGENNPFRVYYLIRNKLLIFQKIFGYRFWFLFYSLFLCKSVILIISWLVGSKNNKFVKINALVDGHLDFLRKRFGIYR